MVKDEYDLDPALAKLMEDEINSIYHCEHHPDENVCDIYKRFKNLARIYAYNLQKILDTI